LRQIAGLRGRLAHGGSRVPGKPDQGSLTLLANAPMRP
jgi:hypothetical protein